MSMKPGTEDTAVIIGETRIFATVENGYSTMLSGLVLEARRQVESMIKSDPFFGTTYAPYPLKDSYDPVITSMCEAASRAGVGPMAAVAGAIDGYVLERLMETGCGYAVLDNDGDIAMVSDSLVRIGLCTSADGIPDMAVVLEPRGEPLSICTSSGKVGHSVSLGNSDLASVIAYDPALADACATALGNSASSDPVEGSERICSIDGVIGCLLIADGDAVLCGDFPEPEALRVFRCCFSKEVFENPVTPFWHESAKRGHWIFKKRLIASIMDKCRLLDMFPEMGMRLEPKIGRENPYRFIIEGRILVFYRIDENDPVVVRAIDGRRNYVHMLLDESPCDHSPKYIDFQD